MKTFIFPQFEQRHKLEALRLRDIEERDLRKGGNKRSREIADENYRKRLQAIALQGIELERREEQERIRKKELEREAYRKNEEPVDDSKLVEAMFDFLKPESASEGPQPSAFRVSWHPGLELH